MNRPTGYTVSISKDRDLHDAATAKRYGWPIGTAKYRVTLKKNVTGKTFSFPFFTGPGWTDKPTFKDVVGAVISDGSLYEQCPTLEEFAEEAGMPLDEPEERKAATKTFEACKNISEKLRALLGDDLDAMAEYTAE